MRVPFAPELPATSDAVCLLISVVLVGISQHFHVPEMVQDKPSKSEKQNTPIRSCLGNATNSVRSESVKALIRCAQLLMDAVFPHLVWPQHPSGLVCHT